MIVPQYWAEGRAQHKERGRQITARRFGWSDTSAEEAQAMADARAQEALARMVSGEKLERREPKMPYNGAQGVPIREEILSRHGSALITRNSYGAQCLNTPKVFFADLDCEPDPRPRFYLAVIVALLLLGWGVGWLLHWQITRVLTLGVAAALLLSAPIAKRLHIMMQGQGGDWEKKARARIAAFVAANPEWHLRVYRTPAGLRVLAMHRTFDPLEEAVAECFRALGTDPVYGQMCKNQRCFRARVSPKPWRIGISGHLRPRPGTWPVLPTSLPLREAWVRNYETAAEGFASCSFVETLGSSAVDPEARLVQELHDERCRVMSALPLG